MNRLVLLQLHEIQNSRHNINQTDLFFYNFPRLDQARAGKYQGDLYSRIIDKNGVAEFFVLAESLGMIGHKNYQGVLVQLQLFQAGQQHAYVFICKRYLAIIRIVFVDLPIRAWRIIYIVRIVIMHPEKKVAVFFLFQPFDRSTSNFVGRPLGLQMRY